MCGGARLVRREAMGEPHAGERQYMGEQHCGERQHMEALAGLRTEQGLRSEAAEASRAEREGVEAAERPHTNVRDINQRSDRARVHSFPRRWFACVNRAAAIVPLLY